MVIVMVIVKAESEGGTPREGISDTTHAEFVDLVFTQGELKQDGIVSMNAISNENASAAAEKDKGYGEGGGGQGAGPGLFGRTAARRKEYLTSISKNQTLLGKALNERKLKMIKRASVEVGFLCCALGSQSETLFKNCDRAFASRACRRLYCFLKLISSFSHHDSSHFSTPLCLRLSPCLNTIMHLMEMPSTTGVCLSHCCYLRSGWRRGKHRRRAPGYA